MALPYLHAVYSRHRVPPGNGRLVMIDGQKSARKSDLLGQDRRIAGFLDAEIDPMRNAQRVCVSVKSCDFHARQKKQIPA